MWVNESVCVYYKYKFIWVCILIDANHIYLHYVRLILIYFPKAKDELAFNGSLFAFDPIELTRKNINSSKLW